MEILPTPRVFSYSRAEIKGQYKYYISVNGTRDEFSNILQSLPAIRIVTPFKFFDPLTETPAFCTTVYIGTREKYRMREILKMHNFRRERDLREF